MARRPLLVAVAAAALLGFVAMVATIGPDERSTTLPDPAAKDGLRETPARAQALAPSLMPGPSSPRERAEDGDPSRPLMLPHRESFRQPPPPALDRASPRPEALGPRSGTLHARIETPDGHAFRGEMELLLRHGSWAAAIPARVPAGSLSFPLAEGTYSATLRARELVSDPVEIRIAAGETTEVLLALGPGNALVGRVVLVPDRRPARGFHVRLATDALSEGPGPCGALTDDEGSFELLGLPAGPVELSVGIGRLEVARVAMEIDPEGECRIEIPVAFP
ncbi:MAG: hypothetical protein HY720_22970 [Planctomycetes bacterium]|nr:hypothetical protein [Planctomycetota bacterium]